MGRLRSQWCSVVHSHKTGPNCWLFCPRPDFPTPCFLFGQVLCFLGVFLKKHLSYMPWGACGYPRKWTELWALSLHKVGRDLVESTFHPYHPDPFSSSFATSFPWHHDRNPVGSSFQMGWFLRAWTFECGDTGNMITAWWLSTCCSDPLHHEVSSVAIFCGWCCLLLSSSWLTLIYL